MTPAASTVEQARGLLQAGRAVDAVRLTEAAARSRAAPLDLLMVHASALKALGRSAEALSTYRRAVQVAPTNGVAHHNLASLLGDLHQAAEAERAARKAQMLGLDAPETWLVLARALQAQGRLDEAEDSYRQALLRRPGYVDAHQDLAQLVWMRTGDLSEALRALEHGPAFPMLALVRARLQEFAGDEAGAGRTIESALAVAPDDPALIARAGHLAVLRGDSQAAILAERLIRLRPRDLGAWLLRAEAALALGEPEVALAASEQVLAASPLDQLALAYRADALRLLERPREPHHVDYGAIVNAFRIDAPLGWPSLNAFLDAVAAELEAVHHFTAHPVGQSLRLGSQAPGIDAGGGPAVRALLQAFDDPIRRYLERIGSGRDPLRRRNTGDYAFKGVWSVRLAPGGRHVSHVHPEGWLSSAFYVKVPDVVERSDAQEGWIRFGEPGVRTRPALGSEHAVRPAPGTLVLFPSYLWHGTVPFSGDATRLTVAFDLVPK